VAITLEWDESLVQRLARATEGNALAHLAAVREPPRERMGIGSNWPEATRSEQHMMLAASGLAIAGSHWALIDSSGAKRCYFAATEIYRTLRHPFWLVLALCSASQEAMRFLAEALSLQFERSTMSAEEVAFMMIAGEMPDLKESFIGIQETLGRHLREVGNAPVGRLGVPMEDYLRCRDTLHNAPSLDPRTFASGVGSYLHRATELVRSARHDGFHWRTLRSGVLPIEPEALAVAVAATSVSHSVYHEPVAMPDSDPAETLLMEVAEDMQSNG
jgi:hypothetical protein